ncbi:hypothetical protein QBC32DRAFT_344042 [Pseudoneurospora amorphoporcata]|uniref:Uncharacterized protein n=1 Tax=Pseudoneurospora amorphoporcata TaxID=241081 RepID=A0AAN6NUP6_9PEZI|nr:hypothetical protein QBC32DRAFT_344042 [Pseudoneurospora amorphoporcata]
MPSLSTTRLHPFTVIMLRYQTRSARNKKVYYTEDKDEVQKTMDYNENERADGAGDGSTKEEHAKENVEEDNSRGKED